MTGLRLILLVTFMMSLGTSCAHRKSDLVYVGAVAYRPDQIFLPAATLDDSSQCVYHLLQATLSETGIPQNIELIASTHPSLQQAAQYALGRFRYPSGWGARSIRVGFLIDRNSSWDIVLLDPKAPLAIKAWDIENPKNQTAMPQGSVAYDGAKPHGVIGYVTLLVEWHDSGQVRHVQLLGANPPGIFEQRALHDAALMSYEPQAGNHTRPSKRLTLQFQWDNPKLGANCQFIANP